MGIIGVEAKENFRRNLKIAMEQRHLSAGDLAGALSDVMGETIYNTTITRWLKGETFPHPSHMSPLCVYFCVSSMTLLPEEFDAALGRDVDTHISPLLLRDNAFVKRIYELANGAAWVRYASLCANSIDSEQDKPLELSDPAFVERLMRREVKFHRVEVFFSKEQLKRARADSKIFANTGYYCRGFLAPPNSIPIINMRSYDNKNFIIGAFNDTPASDEQDYADYALSFADIKPIAPFFRSYWAALWVHSRPLSELS